MAEEIRADYEQLQQIASQFSAQSETVASVFQLLNNNMQPLESGGWIGEGSDAFFGEMNGEVLPGTQRLQQAMDEANRIVQAIVQTVQTAEQEASGLFKA